MVQIKERHICACTTINNSKSPDIGIVTNNMTLNSTATTATYYYIYPTLNFFPNSQSLKILLISLHKIFPLYKNDFIFFNFKQTNFLQKM